MTTTTVTTTKKVTMTKATTKALKATKKARGGVADEYEFGIFISIPRRAFFKESTSRDTSSCLLKNIFGSREAIRSAE